MATYVEKISYEYSPQPIGWGAIIAGSLFTYSMSWLLFTFGSAVGISLIEPFDFNHFNTSSDENSTIGYGVLIWTFCSVMIAFFFGGVLTGRLTTKPDRAVAMLHGVTLWSTVMLFSLLLSLVGIGGLAKIAINAGKTSMILAQTNKTSYWGKTEDKALLQVIHPVTSQVKQAMIKNSAFDILKAQGLNKRSRAIDSVVLNDQLITDVSIALISDDKEKAKNFMTTSTLLSEAQINNVIDLSLPIAQETAKNIEKKIETAQDYLMGILWLIFISSCGALLVAILGAYFGVDSIARIYSYKLY